MKRRNFLGFMTGAVVSGPKIAQAAGEMSLGDLNLTNGNFQGVEVATPSERCWPNKDDTSYAKECLKNFLGKTAEQMAKEKRQTYINSLDPDIAGLRSMSLRSKMEMQRTLIYNRGRHNTEEHLRDRIANKIKDTLF